MPLKWEPAVPVKKFDNLIGSPTFKHVKTFVPSYEQAGERPNMYWLLGWEYGRIWFSENKKWEKLMYSKETAGKQTVFQRSVAPRR